MKRLLVGICVPILLLIFGCNATQPSKPYQGRVVGTWTVKPGVFGQEGELYLVSLDVQTGEATIVHKDNRGRNLQGALSPGGTLLFNRWDEQQQSLNVYTKDLKSGTETRLSNELGEETEFAWFPDGRHFVYQYGSHVNRNANGVLYVMDIQSRQKQGIGCLETDPEPSFCGPPAVSPDGRWVVYAKGALKDMMKRSIVVNDAPEPGQRKVVRPYSYQNGLYRFDMQKQTEEALFSGDGSKSVGRVTWAPDGKGLVFVLEWQDAWWNYATDLVYLDLATGGTRVLVASSQERYANYYPTFAADGKSLLFLSAPDQGRELEYTDWSMVRYDMATSKTESYRVDYRGQPVRLDHMMLVR